MSCRDIKSSEIDSILNCNSIPVRKIQNIAVFINDKVASLSLDSGCEGDCITLAECQRLNIPVSSLSHSDQVLPTQADGKSPLRVVGKTQFIAVRGNIQFKFDGYVTSDLQSPILCGGSFLERNLIVQELHKKRIIVAGKYYIEETPFYCPNPYPTVEVSSIRCPNPQKIHIFSNRVLFAMPGDTIDIELPTNLGSVTNFLVSSTYEDGFDYWYPQHILAKNGKISIQNTSKDPGNWDQERTQLKLTPVTESNHFRKVSPTFWRQTYDSCKSTTGENTFQLNEG